MGFLAIKLRDDLQKGCVFWVCFWRSVLKSPLRFSAVARRLCLFAAGFIYDHDETNFLRAIYVVCLMLLVVL